MIAIAATNPGENPDMVTDFLPALPFSAP